ncbi:MAG TPA: hypothetical protein VL485_03900 [Ktedonobacteraceae bacterium]|jgi:hypothetical protein|nr:hypothetical protein [Ktedonobacteraceae bacterium]
METTVSIEFLTDTRQHLRELDHQLKAIHDVKVDLLEPKDMNAPTLVAIAIAGNEARAEAAANRIAQVLYSFLHTASGGLDVNKKIFLVTAEGERVDIEPLGVEEIKRIIFEAYEGE